MKKILFCIHKKSPFYNVIPDALASLGYEVYIFDYYQSNSQVRLLGLINNVITFDKQRIIINKQINKSLIKTAERLKPDVLFMIKGLHIENKTIESIKKLNIICVNWFQDLLAFMPWLVEHARAYDYLFTPDPLMKRELAKKGIEANLLPFGANPDKTRDNRPKKYGVVFSGQYTKRREKLFKKLTQLGEEFVIWGFPGWKNSSLKNHYHGLLPSIEEVLDKFRQSKIVINVQTAEDKYPSEVVSLRAFEATGVGTFLLNWRHISINNFWKDNKEIVNFQTSQEALLKAKYYLAHDPEREKIAIAGWKRTLKDHTYNKKLEGMLEMIKNK